METFHSILFNRIGDTIKIKAIEPEMPAFFSDLNLDQIIKAITSGKDDYNLKPFFYTPLREPDEIKYRQEIMKDLETRTVVIQIKSFGENMRVIRHRLSQINEHHHKYPRVRLFLDLLIFYSDTLRSLEYNLSSRDLKSHGLKAFREYLTTYVKSDTFTARLLEARKIIAELSSVKYCLLIKDLNVQILEYESDTDYTSNIGELFAKFKQGSVKDYRTASSHSMGMNDVEAKIMDGVALLYPDLFLHLDTFYHKNSDFQDEKITVFDREIQFYLAYHEYLATLKLNGLNFCYPIVSRTTKDVYDYEGFDLALASKLIIEKSSVVVNDFYLQGSERILVVTGPNQGGKTTFARTFGQLHYLASLGCPVPGREAQLFLYDSIFTHFEKEEKIQNLLSKLEDDLIRIHDILIQSTSNSIIIMNEILTSTTLQDGIFLSKSIMGKIIDLDLLCVWVTFIDELSSFSEKTVSMVSTVDPINPAIRTFKIVRKPADGIAYALSIAERYQCTYERLKERIKS